MNCYITLRKICSLPKKPKLDLLTQNLNAADISKKFVISSVVVRSIFLRGTDYMIDTVSFSAADVISSDSDINKLTSEWNQHHLLPVPSTDI